MPSLENYSFDHSLVQLQCAGSSIDTGLETVSPLWLTITFGKLYEQLRCFT